MAARTCYCHSDVTASAVCKQCGRPTCSSCTLVAPAGKFCSPECNLLHREGVSLPGAGKKSGGQAAKGVVLVVLFLVFAVMAVHLLKDRVPSLRKWDLIERVKGSAEK